MISDIALPPCDVNASDSGFILSDCLCDLPPSGFLLGGFLFSRFLLGGFLFGRFFLGGFLFSRLLLGRLLLGSLLLCYFLFSNFFLLSHFLLGYFFLRDFLLGLLFCHSPFSFSLNFSAKPIRTPARSSSIFHWVAFRFLFVSVFYSQIFSDQSARFRTPSDTMINECCF